MLKSISSALIFILFFIIIISIHSCKDQKAEQKQLHEEVMKTHDELMMDMDKIMSNKSALSQIRSKLDSLKNQNANLDTTSLNSEINSMKVNLDSSDDAMMKWMNNFNPDYTGKTSSKIMTYLSAQKIKIDSVKTSIPSIRFILISHSTKSYSMFLIICKPSAPLSMSSTLKSSYSSISLKVLLIALSSSIIKIFAIVLYSGFGVYKIRHFSNKKSPTINRRTFLALIMQTYKPGSVILRLIKMSLSFILP